MKNVLSKKLKIIMIMLVVTFVFIPKNLNADINPNKIYSTNIGIYNAENMELLYGEKTEEQISIASITKVMTAIVAIENIQDLNEEVTINYDSLAGKIDEDLVVAGIYDGEKITWYDLIATMLIPSGADSAIYLQTHVTDSEEDFIQKMNDKAKEIGMDNTHFANVTGLDNA